VKRALRRVLETEISPELVPGRQSSEATVGPYELQDFHLYYILRFGYSPAKVAFLAWHAWRGKYKLAAIRKWLGVFLKRFFQNQFKRSAIPNAPKAGSGGSLSPRGDWRMPSDASAEAWLRSLREVPTDG
jgi:NAD+ synthase (glutamine-hydrolysing)